MDLESFSASSKDISTFQKLRAKDSADKKSIRKRRYDLPKHGTGDRFIKGPIPLDWVKASSVCGRRSIDVAVILWFAAGIQRSNPFKLSQTVLSELVIPAKTARRILIRMQSIGIVVVDFHRGRSPLVTILDLPASREDA